jgi:hypothetical protein
MAIWMAIGATNPCNMDATLGAGMAKETKTREQLADVVLKEARASGKYADLHIVRILGPETRGHTNWDIAHMSSSNDQHLLSGQCRIELELTVQRLQAKYDLADE